MLVLDESGSMAVSDPALERYASLQLVARLMTSQDRLAVLPFSSGPIEGLSLNGFRATDSSYDFAEVPSVYRSGGGGTNLRDALERAAVRFRALPAGNRRKTLVVLTDGMPDNAAGLEALVRRMAEDDKVRMYFVGLGRMANIAFLESLAKAAGTMRTYPVDKAEDLPRVFGEIFADFSAREVSIPDLRPGQTFALGPSAKNLRITMARGAANPEIRLEGPDGSFYDVQPLGRAIGGQLTRVGYRLIEAPRPGVYRVHSLSGAAQVTYEPNFRVVFLTPADGGKVGQNSELAIRTRVEDDHGKAISDPAEVKVTAQNGNSRVTLDLVRAGAFYTGRLPDTGPPGQLALQATASRELADGSKERGVPANARLEVLRRPVVSVAFPQTSRFRTPAGRTTTIRGVRLKSNAHGSFVVRFALNGPETTSIKLSEVPVSAGDHAIAIELDTSRLEPGDYEFSIEPSLVQGKADFQGPRYEATLRILSWWDIWGWLVWLLVLILVILVALLALYNIWRYVMFERWRKRLDRKLRSISVMVEGRDDVYRTSEAKGLIEAVTIGGPGSSIDVSGPSGTAGFAGPVIRIECPRPRGMFPTFRTRLYLVRASAEVQLLDSEEMPLDRVALQRRVSVVVTSPELPNGLLIEVETS
ncbi:MAG: hypothetical protein AMXMBFR81_23100 [Chthonomonas sp.]